MFVTEAYAQSSTSGEATTPATPASETHTETGVPHEAAHEGGFPPFEPTYFGSQLLWLAIAFGLFYIFMARTLAPRIGSIVENRASQIGKDIEAANAAKVKADEAVAAYEQELADAKTKAHGIAAAAREASKAKADAERAAIEASLQDKIAAAEKSIAAIKAAALADVGAVAAETAAEVVRHLVGTSVSDAEIKAAVDTAAAR